MSVYSKQAHAPCELQSFTSIDQTVGRVGVLVVFILIVKDQIRVSIVIKMLLMLLGNFRI